MQAMLPLSSLLVDNGVRLIFITSSESKQTQEFLKSSTVSLCGEIFDDPSVSTYKVFSLKRGVFRSIFRPLVRGVKKYGFKGIVEGFRLGLEKSHLAGDSWQQGGTVLLDRSGQVLYQHIEEDPANWPDMKVVLRLVGMSDASVDYEKAVSDWLKARDAERAAR
ncbi:uncharacterized protein [Haliotis asinina]|uniref:uncharacterized protein n=1 Tax=Haliotis asinina TaxID=109174 RepID=UPI00353259A6